jgi:hypothetical protein
VLQQRTELKTSCLSQTLYFSGVSIPTSKFLRISLNVIIHRNVQALIQNNFKLLKSKQQFQTSCQNKVVYYKCSMVDYLFFDIYQIYSIV